MFAVHSFGDTLKYFGTRVFQVTLSGELDYVLSDVLRQSFSLGFLGFQSSRTRTIALVVSSNLVPKIQALPEHLVAPKRVGLTAFDSLVGYVSDHGYGTELGHAYDDYDHEAGIYEGGNLQENTILVLSSLESDLSNAGPKWGYALQRCWDAPYALAQMTYLSRYTSLNAGIFINLPAMREVLMDLPSEYREKPYAFVRDLSVYSRLELNP